MDSEKPNIMLLEDEIHLARGICFNLEEEGCRVSHFETGEKALQALEFEHFDLIILDVMLPGMDGFEACLAVRRLDARVPILMLTARSEESDRVQGLENGADDYLTKPFNLMEFSAACQGDAAPLILVTAPTRWRKHTASARTRFSCSPTEPVQPRERST